jgi:O-antigen/teichoic acid export membrane protein
LHRIYYLVIVIFGLNTFFNIFFSYLVYKKINKKRARKSDFNYTYKINPIVIVASLVFFADKLILAKFLGFEALAIYSFALLIPEKVKGVMKNFYTLSLVKFSQRKSNYYKKYFYLKFSKIFFINLALVFIVMILIKPIFNIFFPTYLDSILPAQILTLSLISVPALVIHALFESKTDVKALKIKTYLTYLLQIILVVILTLKFGVIGTAFAITISRIFSLLLSIYLLNINKHLIS